jgi:ABC-2 type transport system permease protein
LPNYWLSKMKNIIQKIWQSKLWLLITIIFLVSINWAASLYHNRFDLTNEKRFTLSAPTKNILKNVEEKIEIDVFLKGEFPSGFKRLANSTNEILNEFKELSNNKLQYNFISAEDEVEGTAVKWSDTLTAMGFTPINIKSQVSAGEQQQLIFPAALVHYNGGTLPIILFEKKGLQNTNVDGRISYSELNSAEALMEYKFADAIFKLSQTNKPMLAYSIGNGEPQNYRTADLVENVLKQDYDLKTINLNTVPFVPDTFKLLLIVKPTQPFTTDVKLKIDQFVMHGGKLLLFTDKLNAELDSLRSSNNEVVAYDRNLELTDLLFKYGARINSDLIMDLQCDYLPFVTNGAAQMDFLHWNYFPLFDTKSNHVINKNLGLVSAQFANSIDTIAAEGIKKTVLLSSSANAKTIATPAIISGKENVNAAESEQFKKANIPVALLLEGKFQSLYNNRLSQTQSDSLNKYGVVFKAQNEADNKMIIVADGDIVLNAVTKDKEPMPMGVNPFTYGSQYQYQFANKEFLQNCLDYLINPSGLTDAKTKDYTLRLLDSKKVNEQKTFWQTFNILMPIGLVILFALLYQWRRKRKYTK